MAGCGCFSLLVDKTKIPAQMETANREGQPPSSRGSRFARCFLMFRLLMDVDSSDRSSGDLTVRTFVSGGRLPQWWLRVGKQTKKIPTNKYSKTQEHRKTERPKRTSPRIQINSQYQRSARFSRTASSVRLTRTNDPYCSLPPPLSHKNTPGKTSGSTGSDPRTPPCLPASAMPTPRAPSCASSPCCPTPSFPR